MSDQRANPIRLFDREVSEDLLRERTAQVAASAKVTDRGTKSIVIFRIGIEWLGLPTDVFQEVWEESTVRTLPHRRGGVLSGLVNVRGELLLCVSLENLLGLEPVREAKETKKERRKPQLLVCDRKGDRLAFAVSEIHGIHRYNPAHLRAVPATLAKSAAATYTIGMVSWNGRTIGCLDDELVFYALNKGLA